jgi:hypothetical protein
MYGSTRLSVLRKLQDISLLWWLIEIAPELTGHGFPLSKCEAYNRVYDQFYQSC